MATKEDTIMADKERATMPEKLIVLQELDAKDGEVKESVIAYLMWHSGFMLNKEVFDTDESKAHEIDTYGEDAVDRIYEVCGVNIDSDEYRKLAASSIYSQATKSMENNRPTVVCYLDIEAIRSGGMIPLSITDADDLNYTTPDEIGDVGFTFTSYQHFRDSYTRLGTFLISDPMTVMFMLEHLQDSFIHLADRRIRDRSAFHTITPYWMLVGAPDLCERGFSDISLSSDTGKTIKLKGQVIEVGEPMQAYASVAFRCVTVHADTGDKCLNTVLIIQNMESGTITNPVGCSHCSGKQFVKLDSDRSKTEPVQRIQVQEENISGEQKAIMVELRGNLVETIMPGSTVEITGILRLESLSQNSILSTQYVLGKSVSQLSAERNTMRLTRQDEEEIQSFAESMELTTRLDALVESWAGDLRVNMAIKRAIFLQACGAPESNRYGQRSALHILIAGDPGTAKTMLLKRATHLVNGSRYIDASNATQAGLTGACAQVEDLYTGKKRWAVIPGELALAHPEGICSVDEFNLYKGDKGDFNNALESGEVVIAKIVKARLPTRCSVLAGANPSAGNRKKFDRDIATSYADQLGMDFPQLQRFDAIYTLEDIADENNDEEIAMSMLGHKSFANVEVELEFIQKYIVYSKQFSPTMTEKVAKYMAKKHAAKRQKTKDSDYLHSHRQVASWKRFAIAVARFDLSETIEMKHIKIVKEILSESLSEKDPGINAGDLPESDRTNNDIQKKAINDYFDGLSAFSQSKPQESAFILDHMLANNPDIRKLKLDTKKVEGIMKTMSRISPVGGKWVRA
jgi:DNA replicative helicase MCM subunit Mcm2 (Cdc46/Mcm family)